MDRVHKLVATIANGAASEVLPDLTERLLHEFRHHREDVEELGSLLLSENTAVVEAAAWVVSELGVQARPLLGTIARQIHHPSRKVRFFLIDSLLTCASTEGEILAGVLKLISDGDAAVRWKATSFMFRASDIQLHAAATALADDAEWFGALETLLQKRGDPIVELVRSPSQVRQRVGLVAALRLGVPGRKALEVATHATDAEVQAIATEALLGPPAL